ncbi:HD domain-containing protein [Amycolatopsis sp. K13G38]|uniref:HD domain-containing protein n=2 Tax=Amycolatopsis acididurans TaxID=2724524 RepID=A0ABX1J1V9_9PSEU|nr:HD domain-containing protein [Amycolatopsis acididurans]
MTAHPEDLERTHQDAQIRQIEARLAREQNQLPRELVTACVRQAHSRFADARVQTFVPILVERAARAQLAALPGDRPSNGSARSIVPLDDGCPTYSAEKSLRTWAWFTAKRLLADELPRRWAHTQGVASRAGPIARLLPREDGETLIAAAWLHDIGYARDLIDTGIHQLDGARYLQHLHAPLRLCALVAHHAGASATAQIRGFVEQLAEFTDAEGPVRDALWYCDLTTNPDGEPVQLGQRLAEIRARRGPDDPVVRALVTNGEEHLVAAHRTAQLLHEARNHATTR